MITDSASVSLGSFCIVITIVLMVVTASCLAVLILMLLHAAFRYADRGMLRTRALIPTRVTDKVHRSSPRVIMLSSGATMSLPFPALPDRRVVRFPVDDTIRSMEVPAAWFDAISIGDFVIVHAGITRITRKPCLIAISRA